MDEQAQEHDMSDQCTGISAQQLHEMSQHGESIPLLDVRSNAGYRAGHIPGAQLLAIDTAAAGAQVWQDTPARATAVQA